VNELVKRARIALLTGTIAAASGLCAAMPAAAPASEAELIGLVQNVPSASGYRYAASDDRGSSLDALKIIDNPDGGYLGVYHIQVAGVYYVMVATSENLLTWRRRTMLASEGSHPTITRLPGGAFLVAHESRTGCVGSGAPPGSPNGTCLRFLHYPSVNALLTRKSDRALQVRRTESRCAEGTPNIYSAQLNPDLDHSTIRVGFHYSRDCKIDRQATGTLVNFAYWGAEVAQGPNASLDLAGASGHIGDRDAVGFVDGMTYRLVEGQLVLGDSSSWRPFLWSQAYGAKQLSIRTHRGSTAFANPTASWVKTTGGGRALVFTQFVPASGAAPGEAGELIYYLKEPWTDPAIAAAGDIACDPASPSFKSGLGTATACRQKYTADLLGMSPLAGVLGLGDIQYDQGTLSQFIASYDLSWGRFKHLTYPTVGNHEYATAGAVGYFDYFNGAGNFDGPAGARDKGYYSFDIGSWHLIALNSNCPQVSCRTGSAQEQWLRADLAAHPNRCTLAFWHHPRFSSGAHGDAILTEPLWQALYEADADVILTGHDHLYERFAPQTAIGVADPITGLRSFVVGTGGKSHYSFGTPKPNSEVRNSDTFGVLRLTLHATSYDWAFVPEVGRTFTDFGSAACH
jgi:hypothetical protein